MKNNTLLFLIFFAHFAFAINSQSFFKDSISEFKSDFFSRADYIKKSHPKSFLGHSEIKYPQPLNPVPSIPTQIDYLLIPSKQKNNLIVIQSGVHGIEGLAGASIQNFLLEYLHAKNYETTSFLYIHMVNPTGTYFQRRTNLNNVDLNRNFLIKADEFNQKSPDYEKINFFLNPDFPVESGLLKKLVFYFQSFSLIYDYSLDTLRRSILRGQYSYPKGIYFGGQEYQPEFNALKVIWEKEIKGFKKIVYIDLHTGFGEKGKLHLLAGASDSNESQKLRKIFNPSSIDFTNAKDFYETSGDVNSYFLKTHSQSSEIVSITFEFGTMNSQSTFGSLESLYRMVAENQAYHHHAKDTKAEKEIKKQFRDMFYPPDFEWRDKALIQTRTEIDKVVMDLETISPATHSR